jgi:hypothetical protein
MAPTGWAAPPKNARSKQAEIVFIDETGFSFWTRPGTTWAPKGQTPVLRRVSKRRELSSVVALTFSGTISTQHSEHAIHGKDLVPFLQRLRHCLRGPMILIWDRLNVHRSREVKQSLSKHPEIMVEWLPP